MLRVRAGWRSHRKISKFAREVTPQNRADCDFIAANSIKTVSYSGRHCDFTANLRAVPCVGVCSDLKQTTFLLSLCAPGKKKKKKKKKFKRDH